MSDPDFPTADDLLKGWNNQKPPEEQLGGLVPPVVPAEPKPTMLRTPDGRDIPTSPEQAKAMGMILSGMPFIAIAIRPTSETGHDFFVAIDGDRKHLKLAQDELKAVIDRAYQRKGII